jgi:RNA polymerase sigma factor (TIGR02999 family)
MSARDEITRILTELGGDLDGSPEARNRLFAILYGELRRMAGGIMRSERNDHTLQPTALVNEAYLRLVNDPKAHWQSRAHFFGVAASAMRQILVDHARRRAAAKRGGEWKRVPMEEALDQAEVSEVEILGLDQALTRLAAMDERAARVVELRVFAGLEVKEIALLLGVSERTVHNDWRVAKMWLATELAGEEPT